MSNQQGPGESPSGQHKSPSGQHESPSGRNESQDRGGEDSQSRQVVFHPIGVIRTPYQDMAPYQPQEGDAAPGRFRLVLDETYQEGLADLDGFTYIYVLYHLNRVSGSPHMRATPPWAGGRTVGLFSSRSPNRPNRIGLSVVRLLGIDGNVVTTTGLDVLDGTPLLDIKPYVAELDSKVDANYGWIDEVDGRDHLLLHIRGVPHDH